MRALEGRRQCRRRVREVAEHAHEARDLAAGAGEEDRARLPRLLHDAARALAEDRAQAPDENLGIAGRQRRLHVDHVRGVRLPARRLGKRHEHAVGGNVALLLVVRIDDLQHDRVREVLEAQEESVRAHELLDEAVHVVEGHLEPRREVAVPRGELLARALGHEQAPAHALRVALEQLRERHARFDVQALVRQHEELDAGAGVGRRDLRASAAGREREAHEIRGDRRDAYAACEDHGQLSGPHYNRRAGPVTSAARGSRVSAASRSPAAGAGRGPRS